MSKASDNVDKPNPGIKVTANVDKVGQETTAGAGVQKSEAHYKAIVERALNTTAKPTSKK
jgi:hypothetical protein